MITGTKFFILVITPILILNVSGCRKAESTHTMAHNEMRVKDEVMRSAKEDHGAMKMEHGNSKMESGKSVALPDHFPSDVPIYPGSRVAITSSTENGTTIGLETDDDRQKIVRYYEEKLTAQGWNINKTTSSKRSSIVHGRKNNRSCAIAIGERMELGKTPISVMIMKQLTN
jgi:hypothetical protein